MARVVQILAASAVVAGVAAQWGALNLPSCASSCENNAISHCSDFSLECLCENASYVESLVCCVDQQCGLGNSQDVLSTLVNSVCQGRGFFDLPPIAVHCPSIAATTMTRRASTTHATTSTYAVTTRSQTHITTRASHTTSLTSLQATSSTFQSEGPSSTTSVLSSEMAAATSSPTTATNIFSTSSSSPSSSSSSAVGQSQSSTSNNSHHNSSSASAGEIAGAVVGSLAGLALLSALAYFLARRFRRPRAATYEPGYNYPSEGKIGVYDGT